MGHVFVTGVSSASCKKLVWYYLDQEGCCKTIKILLKEVENMNWGILIAIAVAVLDIVKNNLDD